MHRTPEFDALRGIAAMAIVVFHLWFPSVTPLATGVELFFVLSGFLITGIILRNLDDKHFLRVFYARRALRIWPIYYLALLAVVGFNLVSPVRQSMEALPYYLTYTQKIEGYWFRPETPFIYAFLHTWTLAIEEQFYILWPVLLMAGGRRALRPLAVAFIAVPVAARAAGFPIWILLTKCDGLAMGALLAGLLADHGRHERHRARVHGAFAVLCVLAAAFTVAGAPVLSRFGGGWVPIAASLKVFFTNVFYAGFVGLIAGFAGHPALGLLRDRRLCYLGQISYGLYLYHFIVIETGLALLAHYGVARALWMDVAALAACVAIAALSWRFVERPILSLKDRFGYRPPTVAASPSSRPSEGDVQDLSPAWGG